MHTLIGRRGLGIVTSLFAILIVGATVGHPAEKPSSSTSDTSPLVMIVMDPLAKELSCPCVKGYAQREYPQLAEFLGAKLGRKVEIVFSESLVTATQKSQGGRVDIIIGKQSVVLHDAKKLNRKLQPAAALSDKNGLTTQTGMIVVPQGDAAQTVADLKSHLLVFGPADCDEKNAAAVTLFKKNGIAMPEKLETAVGCEEGALRILELPSGERGAAVISSYAKPLLEGCGTVPKGALRVVGETTPVPFIAAFTSGELPEELQLRIRAALLAMAVEPKLCLAMESKQGFVAADSAEVKKKLTGSESTSSEAGRRGPAANGPWIGWRGANRDAHVAWLPDELPKESKFEWRAKLSNQGVGGIAATADVVLVSDRDVGDGSDIFRCLDVRNGSERWVVRYPAPGRLDYGNSPRATPLIHEGRAYLYGAFGTLTCVGLDDGKLVWRRELQREFPATEKLPWGLASSPSAVDGRLIVQAGGRAATLLALDPATGRTLWQSAGAGPAFASFITATLGSRKQLVGYDTKSLGGWDPATGERLWKLVPTQADDFNVPTPIVVGERLIVASENNGTRLYRFDDAGKIIPKPEADHFDLAPDTHSPVLAGGKLFGIWGRLFCLNAVDLKELYTADDAAFNDYTSLIASNERVLVHTEAGELVLLDATTERLRVLGRLKLFDDASGIFAHPALVGDLLYVRSNDEIVCFRLRVI